MDRVTIARRIIKIRLQIFRGLLTEKDLSHVVILKTNLILIHNNIMI